jgi:hypothetical protein
VFTVKHLEITDCSFISPQCYVYEGLSYLLPDGIPEPLPSLSSCGCFWFNSTVSPGGMSNTPSWHADNFTIVVVQAAWLLLTVALAVAVWYRRRNYEAFQYTHYAVLLFFAAAMFHAWGHWVYTAGGLILFAFDKVTRVILSARRVRCLSASLASPGVTRLVLSSDFLGARATYAGQYVWLNIPSLSLLEWHPFTVSSPPSAARGLQFEDGDEAGGRAELVQAEDGGQLTLHIKDMGTGTWTGRLAGLVKALNAAVGEDEGGQGLLQAAGGPAAARGLAISVDGPYGRLSGVEDARVLVLYAGGIGITPFAALLGELRARLADCKAAGPPPTRLQRVVLHWAVRDLGLVEMFSDTLAGLAREHSALFVPRIFFTGPGLASKGGSYIPRGSSRRTESFESESAVAQGWSHASSFAFLEQFITIGRPPVEELETFVDRAARAGQEMDVKGLAGVSPLCPEDILAMVCGPEALTDSVSAVSLRAGIGFHCEHFTF